MSTKQCVNCPGAEDHSTAQCPLVSEQNKDAERAAFEAWRLEKFCAGVERLKKCSNAPDVYYYSAEQEAWKVWKARAGLPVGVPDGYMPIPTAEQLAAALENVRSFHDMGAELIAPELLANLLAVTSVKAEQVQCEVCHGQGEIYSGHDQHFHYFDFQPPEPIMEVCPECGGEDSPSLPAAGSAGEEVEVVAYRYRCTDVDGNPIPNWYYSDDAGSLGLREPLMTVAQHERIVAARDAAIEEWSGTAVQNGMEVDRLSAELGAVVGVLSAVQEQFNRYGERFPDGFDSRVFRWVDDAMAGHALSAHQSAHVSVLRETLENARRAMFAVLNQEPRMKAVAKRVLTAEIDLIDRALLNGGEA